MSLEKNFEKELIKKCEIAEKECGCPQINNREVWWSENSSRNFT